MEPGNAIRRLFGKSTPEPEPELFVRCCNVYLPAAGGQVLIAGMCNHGGLFAEVEGGVEAWAPGEPHELGELLSRKLEECRFSEGFDAARRRTEWPAYRASGMKTTKEFERRYTAYFVRGANAANVTWQIESPRFVNEASLVSSRSAGTSHADMGRWVLDFHRFHLEVRSRVLGG
jgi:hypothetical protein